MFAESDHRASMKEAFELLVKALHQRQVMDEEMKKSQKILEGQRQDRMLYADLACKYDLRLAWLSHAQCLHGLTHSWVVTASQSKDLPGCISLATAGCPVHAHHAGPAKQDCIVGACMVKHVATSRRMDKWTNE